MLVRDFKNLKIDTLDIRLQKWFRADWNILLQLEKGVSIHIVVLKPSASEIEEYTYGHLVH